MADDYSSSPSESVQTKDTVHSLLISANLFKLRGEMEAAIGECIRALRINPDSVVAHSLLGDIYKDQGKHEEAMEWYKLALDLEPDSKPDLERLETIIRQSEPKQPQVERTPSVWLSRKTYTILLGLVAVILLAAIMITVLPFGSGDARDTDAPVITPRRPLSLPKRTPSVQAPRAESPASGEAKTAYQPTSSAQEAYLINTLNALEALTSRGLQVTGMAVDPRSKSATITFIGQARKDEGAAEELVRDGLIIMKEAFTKDAALSRITIRALYKVSSSAGPLPEIVFMADATRDSTLRLDPMTTDYTQQSAILENQWWRSEKK